MARPREVHDDEEDRYCQKHGVGPHRLHKNGYSVFNHMPKSAWRCVRCLRDRNRKRS